MDLSASAAMMREAFGSRLRIVLVAAAEPWREQAGFALFHDRLGEFAAGYGAVDACFLVRPDGYIGWRGKSWRDAGLSAHLERTFANAKVVSAGAG
jgi:hypothetical protein